MKDADQLLLALDLAVPLWIEEYRGKSWEEIEREIVDATRIIGEHGDKILYGGKGCAEAFNGLAAAIAALSFCPGGVTIFGRHWEAK